MSIYMAFGCQVWKTPTNRHQENFATENHYENTSHSIFCPLHLPVPPNWHAPAAARAATPLSSALVTPTLIQLTVSGGLTPSFHQSLSTTSPMVRPSSATPADGPATVILCWASCFCTLGVADALGLPFVLPYLAKGKNNFSAGVNFAVVGAPALNLTYLQGQNMTVNPTIKSSLDDQLMWFEKLKPSLCRGQGANSFGSTLFVMGEFGSNDHFIFLTSNRTVEQARTYVPKIVGSISKGVERLIQDGAKYIVVADMYPLGCLPIGLTLLASRDKADYDRHGCLRSVNRLVPRYHNSLLRQQIKAPSTTAPSLHFYISQDISD